MKTQFTLGERKSIEQMIISQPLRMAEVCASKKIDPITISYGMMEQYRDKIALMMGHYDKLTGRK
jgi:hypothetical protein